MIKNFIFDWSGTLHDNFHCFCEAVDMMFDKLGGERISTDEKRNIDTMYMDFWNRHFPSLTKEEQDKLFKEAIHKTSKSKLYDGVKETLEKLANHKINLFVLSSDIHSRLLPEANVGGINNLFIDIVTNVYHKDEALKALVNKHKLNPEETAYVADVAGDIHAGKKAGVKTIAITWGFHTEENLKTANPDHIVHKIESIEHLAR